MENSITAEEYRTALADGRIVIVGTKYTKNGWTGFKVFEIKPGEMQHARLSQVIVRSASYWKESNGTYSCTAWGTDRRLEVILSIGYALGLTFSDMRQNYQWLQDTY